MNNDTSRSTRNRFLCIAGIGLLIGLILGYCNKPTVHIQKHTVQSLNEDTVVITQPTNSNTEYLPETHPCDTDYTWPGLELGGSYRSR